MTAGKKKVFATTTGTIWGYIINTAGQPVPVRIYTMVAPGLGRCLFSPAKALKAWVSTILEAGIPHTGNSTAMLRFR